MRMGSAPIDDGTSLPRVGLPGKARRWVAACYRVGEGLSMRRTGERCTRWCLGDVSPHCSISWGRSRAKPPIEPHLNSVDSLTDVQKSAGCWIGHKQDRAGAETIVEIFELRGPASCEGPFDAAAKRPT